MFDAILIDKTEEGQRTALTSLETSALPEGDVLVDVAFSTLNYKDALALTGAAPVVRRFPMVPGIDFAGIVAESSHPDLRPGDPVVLNGWGVGEYALGRACRAGTGPGRLAGKTARWNQPEAIHGHWNRRLYGHALRSGA